MQFVGRQTTQLFKHPWAFGLRTLKGFRANQGLLLAGAVAYYALLSIVPLLILTVIALSHFVDQAALLQTVGRYLEWLVPGQSRAIVLELANFLAHRDVLGWVLLASMLFFSSLAFTVLENAMSVIFHHRVAIRRRHDLVPDRYGLWVADDRHCCVVEPGGGGNPFVAGCPGNFRV